MPSLAGTSGYVSTGTQPSASASMCPVQAHGLAPIGNGPPSPEQFSTACSCNAIASSVVTTAPTIVTGMNSDGSLWSQTATVKTVTDPSYTPPRDCCVQCVVSAKDVQILYWPIETYQRPTMFLSLQHQLRHQPRTVSYLMRLHCELSRTV